MNDQLELFPYSINTISKMAGYPSGEELRDKGIQQAVDHAEEVVENWSKLAYDFLLGYIARNYFEFMTEDVRTASIGFVPEPPSLRAWGGVIAGAARNGIIIPVGYRKVKNNKAHCTPARLWKRA